MCLPPPPPRPMHPCQWASHFWFSIQHFFHFIFPPEEIFLGLGEWVVWPGGGGVRQITPPPPPPHHPSRWISTPLVGGPVGADP